MTASTLRRPGTFTALVPPVLLSCTILWLGMVRTAPPPVSVQYLDKVEHCLVFAVVAYSYFRAAKSLWPAASLVRLRFLASLSAFGLGALLELLQSYVPYRSAELLDLVADAVGAALALVMIHLVDRRPAHGDE